MTHKNIRLFCIISLILTLAQHGFSASPAGSPVIIDQAICSAKVIALSRDKNTFVATIKVMHIYCDPTHSIGETLSVTGALEDHAHGFAIEPVLELGQEGLWTFNLGQDGKIRHIVRNQYGFRSPSRLSVDPNYSQTLLMAHALENVWLAKPAQRESLLHTYIFSQTHLVSQWAISTLGSIHSSDVDDLLIHSLQTSKLKLDAQSAVDYVLSDNLGSRWKTSGQRRKIFENWMNTSLNLKDAGLAFGILQDAYSSKDLDAANYRRLLTIAANNPKSSAEARQQAVLLLHLQQQ